MNENTLYPRFPDIEFANRYARVRSSMRESDLSALILHGTSGSYQEIQFLSNFVVTREAMLVFPLEGAPTMFVQYYNHLPNARRVSSIADIRWGGTDIAAATANNLHDRSLGQHQIGIISTIPLKHYETLRKALPGATLVDFATQMQQLRLIKSNEELMFLRKGAEFSDLAIEALEREATPPPFIFRENMTIVIQPNVITTDEHMGVQVGELVQVTKDGIESLHHYPMRFIQCG